VGGMPIGAMRVGGAVSHQHLLIWQGGRLSPGNASALTPSLPPPSSWPCLSLRSNLGSQRTKLRQ